MAVVKHDNDKAVIFIKNVPRKLKNQFKACCASEGTSMTQELIRYMRGYTRVVRLQKEEKDEVL